MVEVEVTPKIRAEFLHRAGPMLAQSGQGGRAKKLRCILVCCFICSKSLMKMSLLRNKSLMEFSVYNYNVYTHQGKCPQIQEVQAPGLK